MTTTDVLRARLQNKPGLVGATMITSSGEYFDFLNPENSPIRITDIARGLANTCRFGGHTFDFYSVAQHSYHVSLLVAPQFALEGLLHDAAEAYVGDVVGPLKQLIPEFKAIESRVERAIATEYLLDLDACRDHLKHADLRMLHTEQRDLTAGKGHNWNGLTGYEPLDCTLAGALPSQAEGLFLNRFWELWPERMRRAK